MMLKPFVNNILSSIELALFYNVDLFALIYNNAFAMMMLSNLM